MPFQVPARLLLILSLLVLCLMGAPVGWAAPSVAEVGEVLESGTSISWRAPEAGWVLETGAGFTQDGEDGLRTPGLGHGQTADLEGKVVGPGTLMGWYKVSSEVSHDRLQLFLNQTLVKDWSGEGEGAFAVPVPRGTHTLKWVWQKDGSRTGGLDAAWLDGVFFSADSVGLAEALDVTGSPSQGLVTFSTSGGNPKWRGVPEPGSRGGSALFSSQNNISLQDPRHLVAVVSGPALVTFRSRSTIPGVSNKDEVFSVRASRAGAVLDQTADGDWTVWRVLVPEVAGMVTVSHAQVTGSETSGAGFWIDDWVVTPLPLVSEAEALDAPAVGFSSLWTELWQDQAVNPPWLAVEGVAGLQGREGGDVLLSQNPIHDPSWSSSELKTRVTGPGRLSFWCRVAGKLSYNGDGLAVRTVDPVSRVQTQYNRLKLPSSQEWQQRVIEVQDAGERDLALLWGSEGLVLALDEWVWTPTPQEVPAPAVAEAGDFSGGLTLVQPGNWVGLARDQVGVNDGDTLTWVRPAWQIGLPLQATAPGGGWLSFSWLHSTWGEVSYAVNGAPWVSWNWSYADHWERPDTEWRQCFRRLPAGQNTINWSLPDGMESFSAGKVKLDGVGYSAQSPPWVAALDGDGDFEEWRTRGAPWQATAEGAHDGVDALRTPPMTAGSKSTLGTQVMGPGSLSFWWKLEDPAPLPDLNSVVKRNTFTFKGVSEIKAAVGGWQEVRVELPAGKSYPLTWDFQRSDRSTLPGDGAMLDEVRYTPAQGVPPGEAMDAPAMAWSMAPGVQALGGGGLGSATGGDLVRIPAPVLSTQEGPWLEVALPGRGWVSVRTAAWDWQSRCRVDGALVPVIVRNGRLWLAVEGAGPHTCRFQFTQYSSDLDMDDFRYEPGPIVSLAEALDAPALTSLLWAELPESRFALEDAQASHDGVDVLLLQATSAPNASPWVELNPQGRCRVRFWMRAEGPGQGYVALYDGQTSTRISGHFGWQEKSVILTGMGTNRVSLVAYAEGADPYRVWVDQVVVEPLVEVPVAEVLNLSPALVTSGGSAVWSGWRQPGIVSGPGDGSFAAVKLPVNTMLPAWVEYQVTGPGWLRFSFTGSSGFVLETMLQSQLKSGSELFIPPGTHAVRWSVRQWNIPGSGASLSSAELRNVVFTAAPSLNEALDAPGFAFSNTAEAGGSWYGSTPAAEDSKSFSGDDLLKLTGGVGRLHFPVTGPGWLSFEAGWPYRSFPLSAWPEGTGVTLRLLPPPPAAAPDPLPQPIFSFVSGPVYYYNQFKAAQVWVPPGTWQAVFEGRNAATLNQIQFQPTLPDPVLAARTALNLPAETALTLHPADVAVTLAPVSHDGVSALQLAATRMGTLVPLATLSMQGPALLTGWLRTSPLQPSDDPYVPGVPGPGELAQESISEIKVLVDGIPIAMDWEKSGADGWRPLRLPLTSLGPHTVVFAVRSPEGQMPTMLQLDELGTSPMAEVALSSAVDAPGFTWTTGGSAAWQGFSSTLASPDASDAAWVQVPAHEVPAAQTTAWIETTVTGPGMIHYAVQAGGTLEVQLGGETMRNFSAPMRSEAWWTASLLVPPGTRTLRFAAKSQPGATGLFGLDQVEWEPGAVTGLATALDAPDLTFSTTGNQPNAWLPLAVPEASHDETDAVFCVTPLTGSTALETTVSGPAVVSFQYWTGYGVNYKFQVDGVTVREGGSSLLTLQPGLPGDLVIIGVLPAPLPLELEPTLGASGYWKREEVELSAGTHTLRWSLDLISGVSPQPGSLLGLDELRVAPVTTGPDLAAALGQPGWTVTTNRPDKVRAYAAAPTEFTAEAAVRVSADSSTPNPENPAAWPELTAMVPGPGLLKYRWRPSRDTFEVPQVKVAGGTSTAAIGDDLTEAPWKEGWIVIPVAGPVAVTWTTKEDGHAYWLDQLTFEALQAPATATGAPGLSWTSGGTHAWLGIPSVASGPQVLPVQAQVDAKDPSDSWLEATFTGPGRLSYMALVSPSYYWSVLGTVRFDGQVLHNIPMSYPTDSAGRFTLIVPAGVHRVRFSLTGNSVPPPEVENPATLSVREVRFTPSVGMDSIADALDAPDLPWLLPGDGSEWQRVTDGTTDGVDALRFVPLKEHTYSYLATVLPEPGSVTVNQRNMIVRGAASTTGWTEVRAASYAPQPALLYMQTQISDINPLNPAMLDQFRYTRETVPLAVALDAPDQAWETSPESPFIGYASTPSTNSWDQVDAAMATGNNAGSWLQTTVTGPARISFRLFNTGGVFTFDGKPVTPWQTVGWNAVHFEAGPGLHVLRWEKTGTELWGVDAFNGVPLTPGSLLAEALDFPGPWLREDGLQPYVSLTNASDGQDALISPATATGFGLEVNGPGRLQFQLKAAPDVRQNNQALPWLKTAQGSSWFGFYQDAWTPVVIDTIPPGPQRLNWPGGADNAVGRDQVSFVPYVAASLAAGADLPQASLLTTPADPWTAWQAGSAAYDGQDVVISGNSANSWMELTMPPGAGELRLWARSPGRPAGTNVLLHVSQGGNIVSTPMPVLWKQIIVPISASGPRNIRFSQSDQSNIWVDAITFVPAADTFNQWLAAHGLNPGTPLDSDSDGDGTPLLLEYAFGLDASRPGASDLGVPLEAGLPVFSFVRRNSWENPVLRCEFLRRTGGTGLKYEVIYNDNLSLPQSYFTHASNIQITPLTNDWERVQIYDSNLYPYPERRFGRVRVTLER